jgi:peroxiredoxin
MDSNDNLQKNSKWPIFVVFLAIIGVIGYIVYAKSWDKSSQPAVAASEKMHESVPFDTTKEYKVADVIAAQLKSYNRNWEAIEPQLYGKKAPDFVVKGLDGSGVKLSAYAGKEVVLVFWATWCRYCVEEIPSLNLLQKDMSDEVKVLAVSDESVGTVKDFTAGRKMDYTIAVASAGFESMGQMYMIPASQGRPAAMHIGKDGVIKVIYIGSPSLTELKQIVKSR